MIHHKAYRDHGDDLSVADELAVAYDSPTMLMLCCKSPDGDGVSLIELHDDWERVDLARNAVRTLPLRDRLAVVFPWLDRLPAWRSAGLLGIVATRRGWW